MTNRRVIEPVATLYKCEWSGKREWRGQRNYRGRRRTRRQPVLARRDAALIDSAYRSRESWEHRMRAGQIREIIAKDIRAEERGDFCTGPEWANREIRQTKRDTVSCRD
jgi:hypothetical protein